MKQVIFLLFVSMILTGCSTLTNLDTEHNITNSSTGRSDNLKTVLEKAPAEFEEMKLQSHYSNLRFENATIELPTVDGDLYALKITSSNLTQDNVLDLFLNTLSQTFSAETISDKSNLFFGSDSIPPEFNDFTLVYPQIYNGDYEQKIRNGTLECYLFLYQTDTENPHESDQYFMMTKNGAMKMNRGNCTRAVEKARALAGWMPRDNYEVTAWYTPDSGDRFMLTDGSCRVCDAVEYLQQYFSSDVFPNQVQPTKWQTKAVGIMQMYDAHYAYYFTLTREYGGIPFDSLHTEGAFTDFSDGNEYRFDGSEALMTTSGEIEYYFLMNGADMIIQSEQPASTVISLQSAAQAISETMTTAFAFDVQKISMVYCNRIISDTESEARAHWRFILYNPNDERTYVVYTDAETGECFYYAY